MVGLKETAARIVYLVSLVFLWQYSYSQDIYLIKGKITDKMTSLPLGNVNIRLAEFPVGTITSKDGLFNISVNLLPVTLHFSHIGYEKKIIKIDEISEQELVITLEKKSEELDEFVVSGAKVETVYKDEKYSVLDYEFMSEYIILLVCRNSFSKELILLSTKEDTVADLNLTSIKPKSLFKDCYGLVHILCKDTAYQIYTEQGHIDLLFPTPVDEFKKTMSPCVTTLKDKIYFELFFYNRLVVEYHYAEFGEDRLHLLRRVVDTLKTDLIKCNPYLRSLLYLDIYNGEEARILNLSNYFETEEQIKMMDNLRKAELETHYLRKIILTPVFAPLVKFRDTILIFNHTIDRIEFYSSFHTLTGTVPIDYHKDRDWIEEILFDELAFSIYCIYLRSGIYELRKVDIRTGNLTTSTLLYYPFAKKIKVRDDFVYYLYKPLGELESNKLFRQKINQR